MRELSGGQGCSRHVGSIVPARVLVHPAIGRQRLLVVVLATLLALSGMPLLRGDAATGETRRYIVVFRGTQAADGTFELGGNYALNYGAAVAAVQAAGGTIVNDMARQVGVVMVESSNDLFLSALAGSGLVETASEDFSWKAFMSLDEALASGMVVMSQDEAAQGGGPHQTQDALEPLQWDMQQIRAPEAHDVQAGLKAVDVGVLDSGIDGRHPDLLGNVDCTRGRNSVSFLPAGPGAGTPDPCTDNQFHGTHVAGTIAAAANGLGIVGVAPNVTLVPVKVCDASGYCYASAVVDGITYAGDMKFDVINMSFFVDDSEFQQSTEFKCNSDAVQRTFRRAVERALQYARGQGVTPVAALGNSDNDLAHPPDPYSNECDVVPAESSGVVGTVALGRQSEKARYSNYGDGAADVAAPGGNGTTGDCRTTILSTLPAGSYGCIQGTSMASPHAAGVAALIVSQFGTLGADGDVKLSPQTVENYLQATAIDIGLPGYDECFGNGRVDALRAVTHDTSGAYDATAPYCAEYAE